MKERKLVTLSPEIIDDINRRSLEGFNFSEWVEKRYFKENMTSDGLKIQIEKSQKMTKTLQNRLNYSVKKRLIYLNNLKKGFSADEKQFSEFSREIIELHPEKLTARLRCYNNQFNRNLSKSDFLILIENHLDKIKDGMLLSGEIESKNYLKSWKLLQMNLFLKTVI